VEKKREVGRETFLTSRLSLVSPNFDLMAYSSLLAHMTIKTRLVNIFKKELIVYFTSL
jgi:hypothetical protein